MLALAAPMAAEDRCCSKPDSAFSANLIPDFNRGPRPNRPAHGYDLP